jgi:mitochondrial fission protein ELM1
LREQSKGRIKAVCLARPAGTASAFDLVITTAQYRLPPAANILELNLPLSGGAPTGESETVMAPRSVRPCIVLAIGGTSFPERLDAAAAETMIQDVKQHAEARGGAMVCITSPRTGGDVVRVLRKLVDAPHELHLYGKERVNPYRQLIAEADEIIVTSDSVSMVGDALETGRPVFVYPLPRPQTLEWRVSEWLYRRAVVNKSPVLAPVRQAFDAGVFEPGADRRLLFVQLAERGLVAWFGHDAPRPQPGLAARELERAVARVRVLSGVKAQAGNQ